MRSDGFGPAAGFVRRATFAAAPRMALICVAGATLAGCAQNHQRMASQGSGGVDPKYGVTASPRVVADGQEVPKGGGKYHIGKPYTIAGKTYYPSERAIVSTGTASWYGSDFHGRKTANGEIFDRNSISAAHPTMPLPSYARVTNLRNAYSIVVRVNDRGPYHGGRVMDVSQRVAQALDFQRHGTAKVRVEYLTKAGLAGSDDRKLFASLRTDGAPATIEGAPAPAPSMIAEREPERPRLASAHVAPPRQARMEARSDSEDEGETSVAQSEEAATPRAPAGRQLAYAAPLPPTRPFDLGTIPGAGAPIGVGRR